MKICLLASFGILFSFTGLFGGALETVDDIRVAPLIESHWGQKTDSGYSNAGDPCFNLLTPNNAPSGCTSTALAQLCRYWQYPSALAAGSYLCQINGTEITCETSGTAYDWSQMPLVTTTGTTESQRKAIGTLTMDCATVIHSMFSSSMTGAFGDFVYMPLMSVFGFKQACGYLGSMTPSSIQNALCASLDAKAPAILDIAAENGLSHVVLVDGYGYQDNEIYYHLNVGYCNVNGDDAWYKLDDLQIRGYTYTILDGFIYNVFPQEQGDVLSGRVLNASGVPIAGLTVQAKKDGNVVATAESDEKGIYAFVLPGGYDYQVVAGNAKTTVKLTASASSQAAWTDPFEPVYYPSKIGSLGNSWGNDLAVTSTELDPEPEEDSLGAFNPTKAVNGVYPYCGAINDASGVCGVISLKVGKASKGVSKVSGTITLLGGTKYTIKSTAFAVNETGPSLVSDIEVKKLGTISIRIGANGFEATITRSDDVLTAATTDLSKGLAVGTALFSVKGLPETWNGFPVLTDCLPVAQSVSITEKKWDCGSAASLSYKKVTETDPETGKKVSRYGLRGLDDPKKPNLSGLRLTYVKKTSSFTGSFCIYTDAGTAAKPKLKKTTVTITGLVVDGAGTGVAKAKIGKSTYTWPVAIK